MVGILMGTTSRGTPREGTCLLQVRVGEGRGGEGRGREGGKGDGRKVRCNTLKLVLLDSMTFCMCAV